MWFSGVCPRALHLLDLLAIKRCEIASQAFQFICDQDQPFTLWPALDQQNALYSLAIGGVATKPENGFGRIGDDAASFEIMSQASRTEFLRASQDGVSL